jgi:hypothetical protein
VSSNIGGGPPQSTTLRFEPVTFCQEDPNSAFHFDTLADSNFLDFRPFLHDQTPLHFVGIHALAGQKTPFQAHEMRPQHPAVRYLLTPKAIFNIFPPIKSEILSNGKWMLAKTGEKNPNPTLISP